MYGWRAKIGLMIPSINTIMEPETWAMAPEGVSVHTSRLYLITTNAEKLGEMADQTERSAKELGSAECDVIVYGCTSGSFIHGMEWESNLQKKIAETAGCKAITTSGALLKALECFDVKKISIVSPYIQELVDLEDRFFTSMGYEVVSAEGLGYDSGLAMDKVTPEANYAYAKNAVRPDTELLIISCTDFRSIEIIKRLEIDLGIPVITSNQVSLWAALREVGIKDNLSGYGSLFSY